MELLKIEDIVARGHRSKYSSAYLLSKELGLSVLPISSDSKIHFTSPTFAEIVDLLTKNFKFERIIDLFCGSGALSKVALLNGVTKVKCVDVFTKAAEVNLLEFSDAVEIITGDILKMEFNGDNDLLIIDSPSLLVEDIVKKVLPKIKADLVVLYYGGKGDIKKDEKIEHQLQMLFKETFFIRYQLKHACCTSSRMGEKYISYLREKF